MVGRRRGRRGCDRSLNLTSALFFSNQRLISQLVVLMISHGQVAVSGNRCAANADLVTVVFQFHRLKRFLDHLDMASCFGCIGMWQDEREFIATETGNRITGANHFFKCLGIENKRRITRRMTLGIVESLEFIEVDHHEHNAF